MIKTLRKRERALFIIAFLAPTTFLFLCFIYIPMLKGLYLSFFDLPQIGITPKFSGLKNFQNLFTDGVMGKAVYNDFYLAFFTVVFTLAISLSIAVILTISDIKGKGFFKATFFFPTLMSAVVIAAIWLVAYNPNYGLINNLLKSMGLESLAKLWLGDESIILQSIMIPKIWSSAGFYTIVFVAAIVGIPQELIQASIIDGAGKFRQFVSIIIPLIRSQINFCVIFTIINSFNGTFIFVKLLTNGGPNNASMVMGLHLYNQAFTGNKYGYATAIGVAIAVITMSIYFLLNKIFDQEVYEY